MKEKRDETIILRLSKTEKNRIYEKMLSMGIRSLSCLYPQDGTGRLLPAPRLERTATHGISLADVQQQSEPVRQACQRVRQGLRRDMEDLRQRLDELIDIGKQILSKLAEL